MPYTCVNLIFLKLFKGTLFSLSYYLIFFSLFFFFCIDTISALEFHGGLITLLKVIYVIIPNGRHL